MVVPNSALVFQRSLDGCPPVRKVHAHSEGKALRPGRGGIVNWFTKHREMTISPAALLRDRDLSQDGDIIQCLPGTKDYCRKGVFGDGYGELGFLP